MKRKKNKSVKSETENESQIIPTIKSVLLIYEYFTKTIIMNTTRSRKHMSRIYKISSEKPINSNTIYVMAYVNGIAMQQAMRWYGNMIGWEGSSISLPLMNCMTHFRSAYIIPIACHTMTCKPQVIATLLTRMSPK